MILLILCILFGIASAAGYVIDQDDEARQRTWTCTLRSLLAALSFAFLMLFIFWCIFFNEDALLRDHTERDTDGWEHPDQVRIDGFKPVQPKKDRELERKLPDSYRKRETYYPISLLYLTGDSIQWFKLHRTVGGGGVRTTYRIGMTDGQERYVADIDSSQVRFIHDKRPYVQVIRKWTMTEYPMIGRKASPVGISYIISVPLKLHWMEFHEKDGSK